MEARLAIGGVPGVDHPFPKNEVLPLPPVQWRGSSTGQFGKLGGQVVGQESGVAVERTAAATAPCESCGCRSRISAATPAACGDDIDVPLIHT